MLQAIPLDQINRALDRLAAIMDNGKPCEQIKAAALTIDTVLRLHRIAESESRRARQVASNEVHCILIDRHQAGESMDKAPRSLLSA